MHFGPRQIVASISAAAVILCCSCEKHRLGEDPEVQKEDLGETKGSEEKSGPVKEKSAPPAEKVSPTPVEFFPETTPTP